MQKIWIGIGTIVLLAAFICTFFFSEAGTNCYYAQIDNSKLEEVKSRGGVIDFSGGMKYAYTLRAYDENGRARDIKFGTSRELREDAFICLTVKPIRGVMEWREVQYEELPVEVQRRVNAPVAAQTTCEPTK